MPCNDGRDSYRQDEMISAIERVRKSLEPMLCQACSILEANNLLPSELFFWWEGHKHADELRRKRDAEESRRANEQSQRAAYLASVRDRLKSQLTDEEKEAIGLR